MSALFSYKTGMCCAGIHMYMYKASKKYAVAIFPYTDMVSSYDFNRSSGNDTMSSYWDTVTPARGVMGMIICSTSLCGKIILSYAVTVLPPIWMSFPFAGIISLHIDTLSVYRKNVSLDRSNVAPETETTFPYADVKKMNGSCVK